MAPFIVDPQLVHEFKDARACAGTLVQDATTRRPRALDQDAQGGLGHRQRHLCRSARCGAVLGLDRWIRRSPSTTIAVLQRYMPRGAKSASGRRATAAIRRAADRRGPHAAARARPRSMRQRPTGGGSAPTPAAPKTWRFPDDLLTAIGAEPKALATVPEAECAEPLRSRVPHPQPEDSRGPRQKDRGLRRDAEAR